MDGMRISSQNVANVQAYIDYYNIVGSADNGKLFSPAQYEEYKENLRKNAKNRVYTSWRNAKGMDCKMIGPASTCLCGHKYRDHNYINPTDKKVNCKIAKCTCPCFYSVPVHGSSDFKCLCKVSYKLHDPITKKCPKGKFSTASGRFSSTWSCSCGFQFGEHLTVFETREERIALGKPVDDMNRMMGEFGALTGGGLTDFTSMVDGAESFGAQIDAIGSLEHQTKALGYSQSKPALPYKDLVGQETSEQALRKQKLASLNQKMYLENDFNSLSIKDDKNYAKVSNCEVPEEGISALELFKTPHSFSGMKMSNRKALKYCELHFPCI